MKRKIKKSAAVALSILLALTIVCSSFLILPIGAATIDPDSSVGSILDCFNFSSPPFYTSLNQHGWCWDGKTHTISYTVINTDGNTVPSSYYTISGTTSAMIVQYSPDVKVAKENAPGETLSEDDKKTFDDGDLLTAANAKTIAKGGTVSGGKYRYLSAPIDNAKYNDKNRLNKSLVFTNTESARQLVLCAYYYVYNVKSDEIEMTDPVYFYLYDAGNAVVTED